MTGHSSSYPETAQSWEVEIRVNGDSVLTIGHNHLTGIENIDDYADTVESCANHLLAFIGRMNGYGAAAQAEQEPAAWFGIYDGHLDTTIYRDTMERWKALGRKITPLYAAQPSPAADSGWQPIEAAPQDGNPVIVWDDPVKGEAYYDISEKSWWWANTGPGDYTVDAIYPTLWHSLPGGPVLPSTPSECGLCGGPVPCLTHSHGLPVSSTPRDTGES